MIEDNYSMDTITHARVHRQRGHRSANTIQKCIASQPWGHLFAQYVAEDIVAALYPGGFTNTLYVMPSCLAYWPFRCITCGNVWASMIRNVSRTFRPGSTNTSHGCGYCGGAGNQNPDPVNEKLGRPHSDGRNSGYGLLDREVRACFSASNGRHTLHLLKMYSLRSSIPRKFKWTCPDHRWEEGTRIPYEYEATIEKVWRDDESCPKCAIRVYIGGFKTDIPAWLYCTVFIKYEKRRPQNCEMTIKIGVSLLRYYKCYLLLSGLGALVFQREHGRCKGGFPGVSRGFPGGFPGVTLSSPHMT